MHTNQVVREGPRWPFTQAERCSIIKLFLTLMFMLKKMRPETNMFFSEFNWVKDSQWHRPPLMNPEQTKDLNMLSLLDFWPN